MRAACSNTFMCELALERYHFRLTEEVSASRHAVSICSVEVLMAWRPILYVILTHHPRLSPRRARLRLVHG
jgi:hypothetical protein